MSEECPAFKEIGPYDVAMGRGWSDLQARNQSEVTRSTSSTFGENRYHLKVLGREAVVDIGCRSVTLGGKEPQPLAKLIFLHYLAGCSPIEPTGNMVSYRDLPNGQTFYPAFKKSVIEPISDLYQSRPQLLISAGMKLGGRRLDLGSASCLLHPLPKLPVTVIVWKANKEIYGSANMLFDETAARILPPEDLAQVGWFVLSELHKSTALVAKEVMDRNMI